LNDGAIQRKFTDDHGLIHAIGRNEHLHEQNAKRDGKIVSRTFFSDGCRGEIDNNTFAGIRKTAIFDGGLNTLTAFFDGLVRESHNIHTMDNILAFLVPSRRIILVEIILFRKKYYADTLPKFYIGDVITSDNNIWREKGGKSPLETVRNL
jgi:hypothetical protein